ncbi:jg23846 [Pararge aegeria aegeria]|uniref:Jg23846 protein n=1 Tax=Pararge aegeria aegeria TaxID=348720 RepID=A0A8S4QSU0_9NEOP|nr:jg23846 [Pararge aegeria aegeria]
MNHQYIVWSSFAERWLDTAASAAEKKELPPLLLHLLSLGLSPYLVGRNLLGSTYKGTFPSTIDPLIPRCVNPASRAYSRSLADRPGRQDKIQNSKCFIHVDLIIGTYKAFIHLACYTNVRDGENCIR